MDDSCVDRSCGCIAPRRRCASDGAEQPEPRLRRGRRPILPRRAGRAGNLVLRHRVQRPLLHLFLSAAPGRGDRLVSGARRQAQEATCFRPGARFPIPTAACRATRTARLRAWTTPMASSGARATTSSCSMSARRVIAIRPAISGRPVRYHHAPWQSGSAPERLRPPVRHLDRGAGPAQVPEPALRSRQVAGAERLAGLLGRLSAACSRAIPRTRIRASTGCSTARSSRRSGSAWRAAPATSPTIRCIRRPTRTIRPGTTSTGWSATSTAASPTCWARAWRRAASNGS